MIYYYVFNKLFYLILFFFYNNSGIKLKIFLIEAKISCHFFRKKNKKELVNQGNSHHNRIRFE